MSKREFKAGEKVRCFDVNGTADGIVTKVECDCITVDHSGGKDDNLDIACWHPYQVRRLRKKPCPPQRGEGERRVWWLAVGERSGKISQIDQDTSGSLNGLGPLMLPPCSNQDMPSWVRTVELKPGEIILDREKLAKAFWEGKKKATDNLPRGESPFPVDVLERICELLGFEGSAP